MRISTDLNAALCSLNPMPTVESTPSVDEEARSYLLKIATDNSRMQPGRDAASVKRVSPSPGRTKRRLGLVAAIVTFCMLTGGAALASTGSLSQVTAAWNNLVGRFGPYHAASPHLVGQGFDVDGTPIDLYVAPNRSGGQCISLRGAGPTKAMTLASCGGPKDSLRSTPDSVNPRYRLQRTADSQILYGKVDPRRVKEVDLLRSGHPVTNMVVNRSTGYWLGGLPRGAGPIKLVSISKDGKPLAAVDLIKPSPAS